MRVTGSGRPPISNRQFDVIVIGGGVNGVAIARECALGGRRTLLLEQHDFASGTSSRTTRIIHGGLRYLEYGEIELVRQSLKEREQLLQQRPHLVRPINFVLALPNEGLFSRRNAMMVRAGLWVYRGMASSRRSSPASTNLKPWERSLDSGKQWSVFNYEDAQCEFPERLIAEWLTETILAGAVARNYSPVLSVTRQHGRVTGVVTRDSFSGAEAEFYSTCIINATGPWADRVCDASGIGAEKMLGGIRGSHLVVPIFPGAPHGAIYTEAPDQRPLFVIPWNDQILVGSTEVPDDGDPSQATASENEIDYLFSAFQGVFPKSGLSIDDVKYSYAGIRPLPRSASKNISAISRKHSLVDHSDEGAAGLISVIGGKLTTAASVARECARKIGVPVSKPIGMMIARDDANGFQSTLQQWSRQVASRCGELTHESAMAIAEWGGRNALSIVRCASRSPELRQPLCPHTAHVIAEALYAVRDECAVTLADILLRRVPVALGACWQEECSRTAASRIGKVLGWNSKQIETALEEFEEERNDFLQPSSQAPVMARRA